MNKPEAVRKGSFGYAFFVSLRENRKKMKKTIDKKTKQWYNAITSASRDFFSCPKMRLPM